MIHVNTYNIWNQNHIVCLTYILLLFQIVYLSLTVQNVMYFSEAACLYNAG